MCAQHTFHTLLCCAGDMGCSKGHHYLFLFAAYGLGIAGIIWLLGGIFCGYTCCTARKAAQDAPTIAHVYVKDPISREDDALQAAIV